MNWYLTVLKNYANFKGRARRKEYWWFTLFSFLISFFIGFIEGAFGLPAVVSSIYGLLILIPSIAVAVRRLHDIDCSGWWLLLGLVPVVNLLLIIPMCLKGTEGENRFGDDPILQNIERQNLSQDRFFNDDK